ncbi:hypothetical protein KC356_g275 [Hortaea werneckii]|nr:hypothetical protein KC356_g275 [Hortaea werneckii]
MQHIGQPLCFVAVNSVLPTRPQMRSQVEDEIPVVEPQCESLPVSLPGPSLCRLTTGGGIGGVVLAATVGGGGSGVILAGALPRPFGSAGNWKVLRPIWVRRKLHQFATSSALWFERRIEGPNSEIFFHLYAISATKRVRIAGVRYFSEVDMLLAHKEFEKCVNVHSTHPALEPYTILLDFLYTLPLGNVWGFYTEFEGKLTPGLNIFRFKAFDQFEQPPGFKVLTVTFRRSCEVGKERSPDPPSQWPRMALRPEETIQQYGICALVGKSAFLPILVFYATILIIKRVKVKFQRLTAPSISRPRGGCRKMATQLASGGAGGRVTMCTSALPRHSERHHKHPEEPRCR